MGQEEEPGPTVAEEGVQPRGLLAGVAVEEEEVGETDKQMKTIPFFKYLSYVIRHKYFVARECFKHGLYWRGLTHDMSKFLPSEFFPYMNYFYGNYDKFLKRGRVHQPGDDPKFDYAWLLHQKRNKHHWQFWILSFDNSCNDKKCFGGIKWEKLNSAKGVDMKDRLKTFLFIMLEREGHPEDFFARNIGMIIAENIAQKIGKESMSIVENIIGVVQREDKNKLIVLLPLAGEEENWPLNIMEEIIQNVPVVERQQMNFYACIMLMEEGIGTESLLKKKERLFGDGLLKKISQKDLKFYATTAIQLSDIMDIVLIKKCKECQDGLKVLPMPMKYVVEMVCDWRGAGKAQGHGKPGELQEWYNKNKEKMSLHPNTRAEVENLIEWI